MFRLCTLLFATCLLAAADRPANTDAWTASFAKEATGDYAAALAALQPLRQAHADPYLLALRSGWLNTKLAHYDEAIAAYQDAGRLLPNAIEPRLGMLSPLIAAKRWSEAERQARQVMRSDPGCFWAAYWLVESLLGAERWREANDASKLLTDRYPGDSTVLEQAVRARTAANDPGLGDVSARLAILKLASTR
jgi:tetratricopeptide (TPR) repeat protein